MSLISELKRRNVFRVAFLYVIVAWLALEIGLMGVDYAGVPLWVFRFAFAILVIGFPLAMVFSWIYEITPEGLKRETDVTLDASITRETGRRILLIAAACIGLILILNLARFLLD